MTLREELIDRMTRARERGEGFRLSPEELGYLFATPDVEDAAPPQPMRAARKDALPVNLRWLIRQDMPKVMSIEEACFEFNWTEEDFLCCLRQRNCIGYVAETADNLIAGFGIIELFRERIDLLNFAVHPRHQRRGVGQQLVWRLMDMIREGNRELIRLTVRESNLAAQQFFAACGFKVQTILSGEYDETDEDGYEMVYRVGSQIGDRK